MAKSYVIEVLSNTTQDFGNVDVVPTLNFYKFSDNQAEIKLTLDGAPLNLNNVSNLEIILDNGTIVDSITYPDYIELGGPTGRVTLRLGQIAVFKEGSFMTSIKTYNGTEHGSYWGKLRIIIYEDVRIV